MPSLALAPFKLALNRLDRIGAWSADLPLRLFLAWEFFESGLEKWNGQNWFVDIQSAFPFPFNVIPADFSWQLSMWAELIAPLLLLLGLGTRLATGQTADLPGLVATLSAELTEPERAELPPPVATTGEALYSLAVSLEIALLRHARRGRLAG